jgi:hypothetical protein
MLTHLFSSITRYFALAIFALAATFAVTTPSFAATAPSGIDTSNETDLPFSIEGTQIMDLNANGLYLNVGHFSGATTLNISSQGAHITWNALTGGTGETDIINNPGYGSGGIAFMLANRAGTSKTTPVYIASTGDVGIGTTLPMAALDIADPKNGFIHLGGEAGLGGNCGSTIGLLANDGSGSVLSCNSSGKWQNASKASLAETESVTCQIGSGVNPGPCNNSGNGSINKNSSKPHDLCTLTTVAGWSGGLWGQCVLTGSPGNIWNIEAANYQSHQTTCKMTCYDFQ